MNVQPSKHLILINGHTHQGQWLEENSHLSFSDPYDLAECWRNYFNNQILEVSNPLYVSSQMTEYLEPFVGYADCASRSTQNLSSVAWAIFAPGGELVSLNGFVSIVLWSCDLAVW